MDFISFTQLTIFQYGQCFSTLCSANLIEYYAHVRYTVDNWEDYHGNGFFNKAHFYCEMTYTPDCEKTIGDDPTTDPEIEEFPDKLNNTLFDYGCFCQRAFGGSKAFRGAHVLAEELCMKIRGLNVLR